MDQDVARLAQLLTVVGAFGIALTVAIVVLKVVIARIKFHALPASSEAMRVDDTRFARLEQAVDAIALEVERMSEAQRFTAKLMTERTPEKLNPPSPEKRKESDGL